MGIFIYLNILPDFIDPNAWKAIYGETLELLKRYPEELMRLRKEYAGTVERHTYARDIECFPGEPKLWHWEIAGENSTREFGDNFELFHDIDIYRELRMRSKGTHTMVPSRDIIRDFIMYDFKFSLPVFNGKTCGCGYHTLVLALAMLIEDAFPQYAITGGDIDHVQARDAQEMVRALLGKEVALPIRTDHYRLLGRVKDLPLARQGTDALDDFSQLYRGDLSSAYQAIFDIYDKPLVHAWFMKRLCWYDSPITMNVIDMYIAWLNTDPDITALATISCVREDGPRFEPADFASALARTWITISQTLKTGIEIFLHPKNKIPTAHSRLEENFLGLWGFQGRDSTRSIPKEKVLSLLYDVFPSAFNAVKKIFEEETEKIETMLEHLREPLLLFKNRFPEVPHDEPELRRFFSTTKNRQQLPEQEKKMLKTLGENLYILLEKYTGMIPGVFNHPPEHLLDLFIRKTRDEGIILTEDAWTWIDQVRDSDLLCLLIIYAGIDDVEEIMGYEYNESGEDEEIYDMAFRRIREEIMESPMLSSILLHYTKKEKIKELKSL